MALKFFWRGEGETLSATDDFKGSDPSCDDTATASGGATIGAAGAIVGSNGIISSGAGSKYMLNLSTFVITPTEGCIGFYFRVVTWSATATLIYMRDTSNFGNNHTIYMNGASGSGELRYRINDQGPGESTLTTSGANIQLNTPYFGIIAWNHGSNSRKLSVYNQDGTLRSEIADTSTSYTIPPALSGENNMQWGEAAGGSSEFHLKNMFIGDSYSDAATFLSNRNITSYTQYSTGSNPNLVTTSMRLIWRSRP